MRAARRDGERLQHADPCRLEQRGHLGEKHGQLAHFDGENWKYLDAPTPNQSDSDAYAALVFKSPNEIYATMPFYIASVRQKPLLHFDGFHWTTLVKDIDGLMDTSEGVFFYTPASGWQSVSKGKVAPDPSNVVFAKKATGAQLRPLVGIGKGKFVRSFPPSRLGPRLSIQFGECELGSVTGLTGTEHAYWVLDAKEIWMGGEELFRIDGTKTAPLPPGFTGDKRGDKTGDKKNGAWTVRAIGGTSASDVWGS